MATAEIPVKVKLDNAWVVSPGDKLILSFGHRLDMAMADQVRQRFAAQLPGVEIVIVDDVSHMAVYKPDDDALPAMDDAEFERRLQLWMRRDPAGFNRQMDRLSRIRGSAPKIG